MIEGEGYSYVREEAQHTVKQIVSNDYKKGKEAAELQGFFMQPPVIIKFSDTSCEYHAAMLSREQCNEFSQMSSCVQPACQFNG